MNIRHWLILLIFLWVLNITIFAIVYYNIISHNITEAFYLSVQIGTTTGMSAIPESAALKNYITLQSLISFAINIFLIVIIGINVAKYFKQIKLKENGAKKV